MSKNVRTPGFMPMHMRLPVFVSSHLTKGDANNFDEMHGMYVYLTVSIVGQLKHLCRGDAE